MISISKRVVREFSSKDGQGLVESEDTGSVVMIFMHGRWAGEFGM